MTDLMTLREAANIIGVTAATLRRQAGKGVLQAKRIDTPRGAVWMVSREEVERYKQERGAARRNVPPR